MRLCSGPGCGRAIPDGQRFCDECQKEQPAKPSRWERSKTDPIMKLFSNPRWQRFRRLVLQQYPMCNGCHSAPSAVADHRIPARLICVAWLKNLDCSRSMRGAVSISGTICRVCATRATTPRLRQRMVKTGRMS